tara:strand:+ start:14637 stop:15011 length:375 start_codon:yes stop_codon:yes gene_type:complete
MNYQKENNIYDKDNIFAKILRNEIPCKRIHEDAYSLFFHDISPQAKIHVLGIPKFECIDLYDFLKKADQKTTTSFFESVNFVLEKLGVLENGYRIITNSGVNGCQEVPHFHIHILGGEKISFLN